MIGTLGEIPEALANVIVLGAVVLATVVPTVVEVHANWNVCGVFGIELN